MEFGIVAKFRPANRLFDLIHQSLVFRTMFFKVGKFVPAQEALFATKCISVNSISRANCSLSRALPFPRAS
jgi:hypothetical protein